MKLTVEEYNALLAECGCCPQVRCCPPILECQSLTAQFHRQGYFDFESSDSNPDDTLYLKRGFAYTRTGTLEEEYAPGPPPYLPTTGGYSKQLWTINETSFRGIEFTRSYHGGIGNGGSSPSDCPSWGVESGTEPSCTSEGSSEKKTYFSHTYGGPVTVVPGQTTNYLWTIEDAEGDTTEAFTAWRTEFPSDGAYDAAVAAYQAYLAAYGAWEIEYQAWLDGGEVGEPPEPPETVWEPASRPTEFYPKCWFKVICTIQIFPHYFGYNSDGSSAEPEISGSDYDFADWIEDQGDGEPPQSGTGSFVVGYYNSALFLPSPSGAVDTEEQTYLEPVTLEEWKDTVQGLIDAAEFPDTGCMEEICGAYREFIIAPNVTETRNLERIFRYRWKLDKCCGFKEVLSGWRQVFFPLSYIRWWESLALLDSGDPIPPPPVDLDALATKRQWLWTGDPPGCVDSDESDSIVPDHYDHEPMWSPWSLVVKIAPGEEGRIVLDRYWQRCNGPLLDVMPEVTGARNLSDDIPDAPV